MVNTLTNLSPFLVVGLCGLTKEGKRMDYQEATQSIGRAVFVSNGEPEPPLRFNRKHAKWKQNNYTGELAEIKPSFDGDGYRARIITSQDQYMVVNIWTDLESVNVID